MAGYFIGTISGTSADAIDAVLVDFDAPGFRLLATHSEPIPDTLREEIRALAVPGDDELERWGRLDVAFARLTATAVARLLSGARVAPDAIAAIGSHGQTVRHRPTGARHFTIQAGDPSTVAALTGIMTVADFRRMDMALGGEGAPLVPPFHAALFRDAAHDRAVLNLGGIANLTLLPADPERPVTGFDSGPASALLDDWIRSQRGDRYDRDGAWSRSGRVDAALLERLLDDAYFARPPPKSTGREHFHLGWLQPRLDGFTLDPADVQATLVELTAASVAAALARHATGVTEVLACGGGVHNRHLQERLAARVAPAALGSTAAAGLAPDWVEACAFAWLAQRRLAGLHGSLASVTGAARDAILGGVYRP